MKKALVAIGIATLLPIGFLPVANSATKAGAECKIKNNSDYRISFKWPGYSAHTATTIDKLLNRGIYRVFSGGQIQSP